jgi:hypothetical protein
MQLGTLFPMSARVFPRLLTPEPLWHVSHAAWWHHHGLQDMRTGGYSTAPALLTTHKTKLQCGVTRQDGVIPLTACNVAER